MTASDEGGDPACWAHLFDPFSDADADADAAADGGELAARDDLTLTSHPDTAPEGDGTSAGVGRAQEPPLDEGGGGLDGGG